MGRRFVIIKFQDRADRDINEEFIAISDKSKDEIQEKVKEIIEFFYNNDFDDWSYYDLYEELVKQKIIERPDFDIEKIVIFA